MSASVLHVRSHRTAPLATSAPARYRRESPNRPGQRRSCSCGMRLTTSWIAFSSAGCRVFRSLRGDRRGAPPRRRLARQGITRCTRARANAPWNRQDHLPDGARPFEISFGLDEIDLGAWTGLPLRSSPRTGAGCGGTCAQPRRPAGWRNHASGSGTASCAISIACGRPTRAAGLRSSLMPR